MSTTEPPGTGHSAPPNKKPETTAGSANPTQAPRLVAWVSRALDWYYRHFLRGFCYYLPLLLLLLLPVGLLLGYLGTEFGPQLLFFHDQPLKQFVAGVSLALFLVEVVFVGYLLWLRDHRHGRLEPSFEAWLKQLKPGPPPVKVPLPFTVYALRVVACVIATWVAFELIVCFGGVVFDVLSGPADQAPAPGLIVWLGGVGVSILAHTWLLAGMLVTLVALLIPWLMWCLFQWAKPKLWSILIPLWPTKFVGALRGLAGAFLVVLAWVVAVVVVLGWLVAIGLLVRWPPALGKLFWPLVLTFLGLAATVATPLTHTEKICAGKWSWLPRWLFCAAAGANLILVFALVSWCISNCPYGILAGLLTAAPCVLVLGLATKTWCPLQWQELGNFFRDARSHVGREEWAYLLWGVFSSAAFVILLLVVAVFRNLASPVPLLMLVLSGVLAVYGVSAYFIRRTIAVVLGFVLLLAFVAHIQPYRMRFDNDALRPFYSEGAGPGKGNDDLGAAGIADNPRHTDFEAILKQYQANEKRDKEINDSIANRNRELTDRNISEQKKAELREELERLTRERDACQEVRGCLAKCLKAFWDDNSLPIYSEAPGPMTAIVHLGPAGKADGTRQNDFEAILKQYQANETRVKEINNSIEDRNEEIAVPKVNEQRKAEYREELERLTRELEKLTRERDACQEVRGCLAKCLKGIWNDMEKHNQVRAGRFAVRLKQEYPLLQLEDENPTHLILQSIAAQTVAPAGAPLASLTQIGTASQVTTLDAFALPHPTRMLKTNELQVWRAKAAGTEPLVIVAVSGGGLRAAAWAFLVLKRLELAFAKKGQPIDFPAHVRMITGASGGMLGASYYVVTLPSPEDRPANQADADDRCQQVAARKKTLDEQQGKLESDFLTPLMQRLVFNDAPGWLSPWPSPLDRGQALEDAWNESLMQNCPDPKPGGRRKDLKATFESLRQEELEGKLPSLVFAPMMIEDGRRLIISNLDLRWTISNDGWVIPHKRPDEAMAFSTDDPSVVQYGENHSIEAMELFRLFPNARKEMTVGTAVRMSASFPYFCPAISLPTIPRRRVVDAGYYDNYGVSLSAAWLFSEDNKEWIEKNSSRRILLIQIRDGVTEDRRQLREPERDGSDYRTRTLEELTSPPEGLYNARVSSSSFRNDGQLELLARVEELREELKHAQEDLHRAQGEGGWINLVPVNARRKKGRDYDRVPFMVANFELEANASLSWYLSKREKEEIGQGETKIGDTIDNILKWWEIVQEDAARKDAARISPAP